MTTVEPGLARARAVTVARRGLPAADALLGRLAAVVDGVGDEVAQRVGDAVEDADVELDVGADGHELDVLAGRGGDLAHERGEAGDDAAHRHHREAHRAVADAREPLTARPRCASAGRGSPPGAGRSTATIAVTASETSVGPAPRSSAWRRPRTSCWCSAMRARASCTCRSIRRTSSSASPTTSSSPCTRRVGTRTWSPTRAAADAADDVVGVGVRRSSSRCHRRGCSRGTVDRVGAGEGGVERGDDLGSATPAAPVGRRPGSERPSASAVTSSRSTRSARTPMRPSRSGRAGPRRGARARRRERARACARSP